jgi:hypothetical protein
MTATSPVITSVSVGGDDFPLANIEWSATITHGRGDIASPPQPSTAVITLLLPAGYSIPDCIGQQMSIQAYEQVPRFTGSIVSVQITHQDTGADGQQLARVTVSAIGYLARLERHTAGTAGFPEETFVDRATSILDDTGLTYAISNDDGTTLLAEPAGDTRTVLDILGNLCEQVGATMCDLPDGTILLETYTRRAANYSGLTWSAAVGTWDEQTTTWQTGRTVLELPPSAVIWSPTWTQRSDTILNTITVSYGDPQSVVTDTDSASVTRYGVRDVYLETTIRDQADAEARAAGVLTAQAQARYSMANVQVITENLTTDQLTALLNLENGDRVLLTGLPLAAPASWYLGVVEGWAETHNGLGHRITLFLSDPRYSYAMAAWEDIDPALAWSGVDPAVSWADIVLASDLT